MSEDRWRGLTLNVARTTLGDCTNGGVSAKHDRLVLVGTCVRYDRASVHPLPRGSRVFHATEGAPMLLERLNDKPDSYACLVPAEWDEAQGVYVPLRRADHNGPMFGGNYADGDSRLSELIGRPYGAVPIHDRYEGWGTDDE